MDTGTHQFVLTDARGQPHSYVVQEHAAGDGVEIVFELMGLVGPTVLEGLAAALASGDLLRSLLDVVRGGDSDPESPDVDLTALDLGKIGAELQRALLSRRCGPLARKIVSRSIRDGHPVPDVFEVAYQANYLELLQLLRQVVAINRFFPVPSTS